ncbi:Acetyl-coenzyme A transporter 1 family protein [Theileria parva strain Muguga]|uniref:Acetyl-coenzyme A transporter 1 family protein n=1 Tax=Theileria parva strain Muguga TaxID=333668 RepID=UPI001C61CAD2|nr:Acetyl-coenzyme A transporter 1 family protein [Theileria parva strain Muguga]EAN30993.2 Acetyl-coenzyme A transporter 1 family protein [Theileria parva strain Muguga]
MGFIADLKNSIVLSNFSGEKFDRRDIGSIFLLVLLYILQGIPIGIQNTIPIMLNNRVSYSKIAILSLVTFPFSIKLLWAPILDFFYIKKIGKRKSWIVPVQVICGLLLLYGSYDKRMDKWLFPVPSDTLAGNLAEDGSSLLNKSSSTQIMSGKIFLFFLVLYFLLATQDIAVDGWALTILRPHLRVHASACNSAGQSFGANLAFFLILGSNSIFNNMCKFSKTFHNHFESFCSHLKSAECVCHKCVDPVVSISGFMRFFGIIILITTFFLMFKKETTPNYTSNTPSTVCSDVSYSDPTVDLNIPASFSYRKHKDIGSSSRDMDVAKDSAEIFELESVREILEYDLETGIKGRFRMWNSYKTLKKVITLAPIKTLAFLLLTKYLFFSPENPIDLKMLSYGLSQDLYAITKSFTIVVDIVFPLVTSYYIVLYGISNTLYRALILRFGSLIISTGFLIITKYYFKHDHYTETKFVYVVLLSSVIILRRIAQLLNTVTDVALFNKVSDPKIGAIYMTLLNTLANFGGFYPNYIALLLVDTLTFKKLGINGVFVECLICIACGFWIIPKFKLMFEKLDQYDEKDWTIEDYT